MMPLLRLETTGRLGYFAIARDGKILLNNRAIEHNGVRLCFQRYGLRSILRLSL
jgi:hypothetical protein